MKLTFKEWVMEMYSLSVYQIGLQVAIAAIGSGNSQISPRTAWRMADEFISEMERRYTMAAQD